MVPLAARPPDKFEFPMSLSSSNASSAAIAKDSRSKRDRIGAATAALVSLILGTAAAAAPPQEIVLAHDRMPVRPVMVQQQRDPMQSDQAQSDRLQSDQAQGRLSKTIMAAFVQEPPPIGPEIDELDMTDLEALEQRLNLDSLDDLKPNLEAMERRLNLQDDDVKSEWERDLEAPGDETNDDENENLLPPSTRENNGVRSVGDQFEMALPEVVDGRFVMPPLWVATLDTRTVGNGRRPDSFRSASQTPRMPLPESAFDRSIVWNPVHRTWVASGNYSHPLYFEDRMLERHGHVRWGCLQPLASGARFFSSIALLPYLASIEHPCECRYSMGYLRTGSCTPAFVQRPPWDREAFVAQSISTAGGLWIFP